MANGVAIRCPQGIQRLIDLGRAIALARNWNHPLAKEALVGLWLDAQLTRAGLRGTTEVIGERVQATVAGQVADADSQLIDDVLRLWLASLDRVAPLAVETQNPPRPLDVIMLDVQLPKETGVIPLAAGIAYAIVAGTTVVGAVAVSQWGVVSDYIKGSQEAQARAAETATALTIADNLTRDKRPMNDAERVLLGTQRERQVVAASNLTAPKKSLFGDLTGTEILIGAGLAIALLVALNSRSPK